MQKVKNAYKWVRNQKGIKGWLIQVIILFLVIKFIIYPSIGLITGTSVPIVAVISKSMEHSGSFDDWWENQQGLYAEYNITKEQFQQFPLENGIEQGDLIILKNNKNLKIGDILIFKSEYGEIIHRLVTINNDNGTITYTTKGDNNKGILDQEKNIVEQDIIGRSWFSIPYLGNARVAINQLTGGR